MNNWIKRFKNNFGCCDSILMTDKKTAIKACIENEKYDDRDTMKCPICGSMRIVTRWYDIGVVETRVKCKDHWEESWAYGRTNNRAFVNGKGYFCEFYDSDEEEIVQSEIKKYECGIEKARIEYLKRIKKIKSR